MFLDIVSAMQEIGSVKFSLVCCVRESQLRMVLPGVEEYRHRHWDCVGNTHISNWVLVDTK